MKNLFEVRWHGRGGQGAKTAAQFLGEAALDAGKFIQAFPEYGPERAGAPMRAFTRISDLPITIHSGVINPEVVVVIDPTLLDVEPITEGLGNDGVLLVNTSESAQDIRKKTGFNTGKVAVCDATRISLETLGSPMPNTPMLGALLKVVSVVPVEKIEDQVKQKFLKKLGQEETDSNIKAIRRAYDEVKIG
jgi:pyruvate ferredoxin oxidoreductase gamma subunit